MIWPNNSRTCSVRVSSSLIQSHDVVAAECTAFPLLFSIFSFLHSLHLMQPVSTCLRHIPLWPSAFKRPRPLFHLSGLCLLVTKTNMNPHIHCFMYYVQFVVAHLKITWTNNTHMLVMSMYIYSKVHLMDNKKKHFSYWLQVSWHMGLQKTDMGKKSAMWVLPVCTDTEGCSVSWFSIGCLSFSVVTTGNKNTYVTCTNCCYIIKGVLHTQHSIKRPAFTFPKNILWKQIVYFSFINQRSRH